MEPGNEFTSIGTLLFSRLMDAVDTNDISSVTDVYLIECGLQLPKVVPGVTFADRIEVVRSQAAAA
jgi:hypothetical protein